MEMEITLDWDERKMLIITRPELRRFTSSPNVFAKIFIMKNERTIERSDGSLLAFEILRNGTITQGRCKIWCCPFHDIDSYKEKNETRPKRPNEKQKKKRAGDSALTKSWKTKINTD